MPLIEELPVTTTQRTTQGWAYVPDIKPQQQPLEARKRGARNQAANKGEISAKQLKAIQTKLNELDKENYKDTTIPVPAKFKERAGRKITPNVRRILTYQRTFAHYLADEEAQLAQNGNPNTLPTLPQTPTLARSASSRGAKAKQTPMQPPPRPSTTRKTPAATPTATPTPTPTLKRERSSSASISTASALQQIDIDPSSITTTPQAHHHQPTTDAPFPPSQSSPPPSSDDHHPLLRTHPSLKPPTPHLLSLLLSEPPLSYSASRAQPLEDFAATTTTGIASASRVLVPKPGRHFCSICGYWGKVKCKKCGERTCGLMECWRGHEGVCSVPDY